MRTVGMERYRKRTVTRLGAAFVLLVVLTVLAVFFLPDQSWVDALIGIVAGGLIIGISAITLDKMVDADGLAVGWLVIDYVAKILVAAAAILITKDLIGEDPLLVAICVIAAVVFTAFVPIMGAQVQAREELTEQ